MAIIRCLGPSPSLKRMILKCSSELIPGIHHCTMQCFNNLCPFTMGQETKNSAKAGEAGQGVVPKPALQQTEFVVAVQSLSHVQLFVTPWTTACQAFLSFTISWSLLKTHVH